MHHVAVWDDPAGRGPATWCMHPAAARPRALPLPGHEVDTPERHGLTGTIRSARSPVADRVFPYPFRGGCCDAISTARWDSVSAPSGRLRPGGDVAYDITRLNS